MKPRDSRPDAARVRAPDGPPPRVLVNLTAFDALASGARERALGIAGGLRALGAEVLVAEALGADLADRIPSPPGAVPVRTLRVPLDPRRPWLRAWRGEAVFARLLAAERPDVFLTDFHPVPRVPGVRTVVTVHDLRDLEGRFARSTLRRLYMRALYPARLRRAHCVVTPSCFTRDAVAAGLGIDRDRIAVIPNAVSEALRAPLDPAVARATRERLDLPRRPYLLALGVLEARKNLERLLRATARLRERSAAAPPLVVAGRGGPEEARLRAVAGALLPPGAVHWAGYVRPADLAAVYDGAAALVHPALYEGWGMPVVEAMARGIPVACSTSPALPEAAGGAARLFDGEDVAAMAAALDAVVFDAAVRADLVRRGLDRAAGLTWSAAAAALLDALGLGVHGPAAARRA